jgi:putative nucleotidyltransferase with HDIG domain
MPARILVVDDEKPIREIVTSILRAADYQFLEAGSGLEALAFLDSGEKFDLILSNLMMAELDGIGLLERVQVKYPDIPFVAVTAVHDISIALAVMRVGAYDYLLKPFEREQLLATVRRALENHRVKMENRKYQADLESLVVARTEELHRSMEGLERSYDFTLEGFGDALSLGDFATAGHCKRVTAYAIALARAIGLSGDEIRVISRGAFLHDIGKLATPDAILRKPGALSPDEMMVMREHCLHGYQIVKKIPFLVEAAEIVFSHHERYDGTGYPRRLKGDAVLLGAKIVAVVNTMDAITSDAPYRVARPLSAAKEEIARCSGSQFDPRVVEAFLSIPDHLWHDLRRGIESEDARS